MRPIEPPQKVGVSQPLQLVVELDHLSIIEVVCAHGREDREPRFRGGGSFWLEACSIQDHACGALANLREPRGHTRASRKSREINAAAVDREALLRIL